MTVSCERLDIYIAGRLCGVLTQNRDGALSFKYVHHYEGVPLSVSMPVGLERGYRIEARGGSGQRRCRMDRCRRNARPMVPCWLPGKNFSNYLIGATDAHAKNHSLLLIAPDDIRLVPLYDVASIAPYRSLAPSARKPRSRNFPQTRLSSSCA